MNDEQTTQSNLPPDNPSPPSPPTDDEGRLIADPAEEEPIDALPLNPWARRLVIGMYILIVTCVILGLLLSLVWSGILAEWFGADFSIPWPETM